MRLIGLMAIGIFSQVAAIMVIPLSILTSPIALMLAIANELKK